LDARLDFSTLDLQIVALLDAGLTQSEIGHRLHIEQPAVSRSIQNMETRCGLQLVVRDGRRSALTAAGRDIARSAGRILKHLENVDALAASLREGRTGRVSVLTSNTPGSYVLPQQIAAFLAQVPDVLVDLEMVPDADLIDTFSRGNFDFAVSSQKAFPADFTAEKLYNDFLVFFAAVSSRLADRATLTFTELVTEPLVGRFVDHYWLPVFAGFEKRGVHWTKRVDLRSSEAVKRFVEAGVGVGALFESAVRDELAAGTLVRLPLEVDFVSETFWLLWRSDLQPSAIAQQFRAFLQSRLDGTRP
jgi:DNA-binding transcriptional LysR family regulator